MNPVAGVLNPTVTREALLEQARRLPAAPQVIAGLCELLQDVNTNLDQVAAEIRLEPTLAARVIRVANSAVFGGSLRVGSVDEAVNRVGFGEVMRLVGAATVAGLVDRALTCYGIPAEKLRESLLLHALASEALAARADIDARSAYAAGLLRGLGMMVLDRVGRAGPDGGAAYPASGCVEYGEWERARFGFESPAVTRLILDEWRFPPAVTAAVGEHLLKRPTSYENRFACLLNLAGWIVAENGRGLPGEEACWQLTPEKLAGAGIGEDGAREAARYAVAVFEQQRAALY